MVGLCKKKFMDRPINSTHVAEIPCSYTGIQNESSRLYILRLRQADVNSAVVDESSTNRLSDDLDIISSLYDRPISLEDRQRIAEIRLQRFGIDTNRDSASTEIDTEVVQENSDPAQDLIMSSGLSPSYFDPDIRGFLDRPTIIPFPENSITTEEQTSAFADLLIRSTTFPENLEFPILTGINTTPALRSSTNEVVRQIFTGVHQINTNSTGILEFYRRQVNFIFRTPHEEFAEFTFFPYENAVFATFRLLPRPVLAIILAQLMGATGAGSYHLVIVIYQLLRPLLLTVVPFQFWSRLTVRNIVEITHRLLNLVHLNLTDVSTTPFYRRIPRSLLC
jgi:hypothetical protein